MQQVEILKVYRNGRPTEIQYIKQDDNDKYGLLLDVEDIMVAGEKFEVRRLIALKTFADVRLGQEGGRVSSFDILDSSGDCWIYPDAVVAGDSVVKDDCGIENIAVLNSKLYGSCDINGSDSSYIKNSVLYDTAIYSNIRISNATCDSVDIDVSGFCKILKSTLKNIKTSADIVQCEIIRSKVDNVVFDSAITMNNITLTLVTGDTATNDDSITLRGGEWSVDATSTEETALICINRVFHKGEVFTFEEALKYRNCVDGIRYTENKVAKVDKLLEEMSMDEHCDINASEQVYNDVETSYACKAEAKSSLEEFLKGLAGK